MVHLLLLLSLGLGQAEQKASLKIENQTLPVIVRWTTDKGEPESLESDGPLPVGTLTVSLSSRMTNAWYQAGTFQVNDGPKSELTLTPLIVTLKKGDRLTIHCASPVAPWNGVIVEHANLPILVSLARPLGGYDVKKWEDGKGGPEEFPNSPFFIAHYGEKEMAKRLAASYFATGKDRADHLSVIPATRFQKNDLSEKVLAEIIERGLIQLRTKAPPQGQSIANEINIARDLLNQGRGKKKN